MSLLAHVGSHELVKCMETTWNGEAESTLEGALEVTTVHLSVRN